MAEELKSIPNPYEAQAEEDGLEFLNRIGEKINAAVSVKSQRLVVVLKGAGQSVGGVQLDLVVVTNGKNILSYEVTLKDEPKHGEVEASYYDRKKNSREVTTAGTGMEGPKFVIPTPFQNKEDAQRATDAKVKELVRAQADASFVIDGAPFAQAEA
ncbi:phage protein D [Rhizobium azooxidifex]|uniref:Phage protein D n=1 Tax=Mycoplana azooxidifex TaxID=1636188 RepID=A0A7W6DCJ6_9HYPH|nr:hypothetical protein [Mycoplana azooxidifex]MBB3980079.1 phage protein D [Mycoplana azooxidifex]